jgi:hypothetical protein
MKKLKLLLIMIVAAASMAPAQQSKDSTSAARLASVQNRIIQRIRALKESGEMSIDEADTKSLYVIHTTMKWEDYAKSACEVSVSKDKCMLDKTIQRIEELEVQEILLIPSR